MYRNFQEKVEQFIHQMQGRALGQIMKLEEPSYVPIPIDPQISAKHRRLLAQQRLLNRRKSQLRYCQTDDDWI